MFQIAAFYKFVPLSGLEQIRERLKFSMAEHSVKGTIIIAEEGFNSTLCGKPQDVTAFLRSAESILGSSIEFKSSFHHKMPFRRIVVKIKPEIVTLKQKVDIGLGDGTHVSPHEWNALLADPETVILDTRNEYEIKNGSFKNAVDPRTKKFSELPKFIEEHFGDAKGKKIAMYCTGGIRCEKFAPYLRSQGFERVFQLQGGILKYLETVDPRESLWNGECFVFDDRITLNERLEKGRQIDYSRPNDRTEEAE